MSAGAGHNLGVKQLTLLLPARNELRMDKRLPASLAKLLARGDHPVDVAPGRDEQLLRVFEVIPRRIAVAALTRQRDVGDAARWGWLRCDPAHLRADLAHGRMLACGDLGLRPAEVEQLTAALRPLFGDEGMTLSAPHPTRWYLQVAAEARMPEFVPPAKVLGDDVLAHMPQGDEGKRWCRLLNEAQVILHNHPINAERAEHGQLAANSLWFWGAGVLPDHVSAPNLRIASHDVLVSALARQARATQSEPFAGALLQAHGPNVVDLIGLRDVAELAEPWLERAFAALAKGNYQRLCLDFADGARRHWQSSDRYRFWRRPLHTLQ